MPFLSLEAIDIIHMTSHCWSCPTSSSGGSHLLDCDWSSEFLQWSVTYIFLLYVDIFALGGIQLKTKDHHPHGSYTAPKLFDILGDIYLAWACLVNQTLSCVNLNLLQFYFFGCGSLASNGASGDDEETNPSFTAHDQSLGGTVGRVHHNIFTFSMVFWFLFISLACFYF